MQTVTNKIFTLVYHSKEIGKQYIRFLFSISYKYKGQAYILFEAIIVIVQTGTSIILER